MYQEAIVKEKFPLIFGRRGGYPLSALSKLQSSTITKKINELLDLENRLKLQKNQLINELHHEIQTDQGKNKKLLNLKRDVFNLRNIDKYNVVTFSNQNTTLLLEKFKKSKSQLDRKKEEYNAIFEIELRNTVQQLGSISQKKFFRNGLLFSSQVLYNELQKNHFETGKINKKSKRFFISILKYLTRSLTKTTPFSSFNNIFFLEQDCSNNYKSEESKIISSFTVNNLVFYYVKEVLLTRKEIRSELALAVNNTVWNVGEKNEIHFYINQDNNESFKKLGNSELISFIKKEVSDKNLKYRDLVETVTSLISEDTNKVESFIDVLLKEGFLTLNFPISFYDSKWVDQLKEFIQFHVFNTEFFPLIEALTVIGEKLKQLAYLSTEERKTAMKESYVKIKEALLLVNPKTQFPEKVTPQDLYFEDTLAQTDSNIESFSFENLEASLKEANACLNNASYKETLKIKFAEILNSKYNGKLPLLKFYQNIYLNKDYQDFFNHFPIQKIKNSLDQLKELKEKADSINSLDVKNILSCPSFEERNISFGAHFQVINNDFSKIVLNNFSKGNGANSSRFFNLCSKSQIEKAKRINNNKDVIIADVKDASLHNTNIYPPLSTHIISLTNDSVLEEQFETLNISNLFVVSSKKEGIVLMNAEGKIIVPIQFSLEGSDGKSKLTHFLDLFDPNENFGARFLRESFNALYHKELEVSNVVNIPRLCFGNQIVIQRMKWLVKTSELSFMISGNVSISELFFELNKWRLDQGIPDKVFVKIKNKEGKSFQDDNYKPQYIDFTSPIFTMLFQNMISKSNDVIEFTEMLPNTENVIENGGYVKEYVVTIDA